MRLTSKGRYAVTAILDIAIHQKNGLVSVKDIAKRQNISESYLEQLLGRLRQAQLVLSQRGPGGGYSLKDNPSKVSVSRIIQAVGEGVDVTLCSGSGDCNNGDMCLTHNLWASLSREIDRFLVKMTLDKLVHSNQSDVDDLLSGVSESLIHVSSVG
ncbi:MAG: Rrf2 family transcriptional regulator [Candidatus Azotimanducaceae bacterium]